ncbi:2-amino-4-oxopentanoate thiolase subunit OrtA [Kaistia adipata]|uniref:2-amino-4-oxopentanoate thiolase subunit OrtA n=1 Tax=Kaistia adipata TaxID=166954 RepID=UPI000491A7C9|nr:2-amino-4-oxopentanoate thiolase subunit OrtA [Kaistia adipata]
MSKLGNWVQIHDIILEPHQRPASLPEETRRVPLEMRVKGWLLEETAELGDTVRIRTAIGTILSGVLIADNPAYGHDFGRAVPELLAAGDELVALMKSNGAEA